MRLVLRVNGEAHEVGVSVANATPDQVLALLAAVPECPPLEDLADFVENLRTAKYDLYLSEDLLRRAWIKRNAHLREDVTRALHALVG